MIYLIVSYKTHSSAPGQMRHRDRPTHRSRYSRSRSRSPRRRRRSYSPRLFICSNYLIIYHIILNVSNKFLFLRIVFYKHISFHYKYIFFRVCSLYIVVILCYDMSSDFLISLMIKNEQY